MSIKTKHQNNDFKVMVAVTPIIKEQPARKPEHPLQNEKVQKAKSAVAAPVKIVHQQSEPMSKSNEKKEEAKVTESATEEKLSCLSSVYNPKGHAN